MDETIKKQCVEYVSKTDKWGVLQYPEEKENEYQRLVQDIIKQKSLYHENHLLPSEYTKPIEPIPSINLKKFSEIEMDVKVLAYKQEFDQFLCVHFEDRRRCKLEWRVHSSSSIHQQLKLDYCYRVRVTGNEHRIDKLTVVYEIGTVA